MKNPDGKVGVERNVQAPQRRSTYSFYDQVLNLLCEFGLSLIHIGSS